MFINQSNKRVKYYGRTWNLASLGPLTSRFARGILSPRLAGQLTQVPCAVLVVAGGQEALLHPVFETNAALALASLANLKHKIRKIMRMYQIIS